MISKLFNSYIFFNELVKVGVNETEAFGHRMWKTQSVDGGNK